MGGGGGGGSGRVRGGQGGCEWRSEAFVKIQFFFFFFFFFFGGGGGGRSGQGGGGQVGGVRVDGNGELKLWGGGRRVWGQGGCERRSKVFVKKKKKKKKFRRGGGWGGGGGRSGVGVGEARGSKVWVSW